MKDKDKVFRQAVLKWFLSGGKCPSMDLIQFCRARPNFSETKTMDLLIRSGRMIFGAGIAALGVLQFFVKDFIVARPPASAWAADIPGKLVWAYVSGILLIIFGLAMVLNKKARIAAI
jgi:uncharacterized membrane protein YphA (DoxX/SURF4 family)